MEKIVQHCTKSLLMTIFEVQRYRDSEMGITSTTCPHVERSRDSTLTSGWVHSSGRIDVAYYSAYFRQEYEAA
jgi:hypothetical protein